MYWDPNRQAIDIKSRFEQWFALRLNIYTIRDTNEHIGYLVVDATAHIAGDTFTNLESDVNILIGPDLFNPFDIIPLGPTEAVGTRISVD